MYVCCVMDHWGCRRPSDINNGVMIRFCECMYVCMYVCMCCGIHHWPGVCMYVCMYVCMFCGIHHRGHMCPSDHMERHDYMYVCMHVCVCMYKYFYLYIHTHTHTYTYLIELSPPYIPLDIIHTLSIKRILQFHLHTVKRQYNQHIENPHKVSTRAPKPRWYVQIVGLFVAEMVPIWRQKYGGHVN